MAHEPHKNLDVWKKGIELTISIYRMSEKFPEHEKFGLASQMRRAAISVPSNIAEGAGRNTKKEFSQFLHNARGSLAELDTQMIICKELGYCSQEYFSQLDGQMEVVSKLLAGLIRSLKNKQ